MHSNKSGSFQEVMALKLQEGINCIKVSESAEYCRMAACTNGGTLAYYHRLYLGFGTCSVEKINPSGPPQPTQKPRLP